MIHILHPEVKEAIDRQAQAIQRVRELHKPEEIEDHSELCKEFGCQGYGNSVTWCYHCEEYYPCDTIKALDGEQ